MRIILFILIQFVTILCLFNSIDARSLKRKHKHESRHLKRLLSPVILIPGLGGNRLQAKLNKPTSPHFWCDKKTDRYFDIWFGLRHMMPPYLDCWVDNMKLRYDNIGRRTKNNYGVKIKVPPFGDTEPLEWISQGYMAYFYEITQALVDNGYVRNKSIFGAPYDFRKGPNENEYWFRKLKNLTEHAYEYNDNVGVTYIAHSMGGKMILHFLQQMPQEWKDKYVKRMISLATPWGGTALAVQAASIGYDLGVTTIPNKQMKAIQETFPAIAYLMPSKFFWKPYEVLATIGGKNYTVENLEQFFTDIGSANMAEMMKDLADYNSFEAPGVEVHCLYSTGKDTVERLDFGAEFNAYPTIIEGAGDGQVNKKSLIGCMYWKDNNNRKIYVQDFSDEDHIGILGHTGAKEYILRATGIFDSNNLSES